MIVGFTGTQKGMTENQRINLIEYMRVYAKEFHHGDCIGSDSEAHEEVKKLRIPIVIHPSIKENKRAFCKGYSYLKKRKSYVERNCDIVDSCEVLIACPKSEKEELRSGTWATVRYARRVGKMVVILNP
jgi:hypothetical protein